MDGVLQQTLGTRNRWNSIPPSKLCRMQSVSKWKNNRRRPIQAAGCVGVRVCTPLYYNTHRSVRTATALFISVVRLLFHVYSRRRWITLLGTSFACMPFPSISTGNQPSSWMECLAVYHVRDPRFQWQKLNNNVMPCQKKSTCYSMYTIRMQEPSYTFFDMVHGAVHTVVQEHKCMHALLSTLSSS